MLILRSTSRCTTSAIFPEVQKGSAYICFVLWGTEGIYLHVKCFVYSERARLTEALPTMGALEGFLLGVDVSETEG